MKVWIAAAVVGLLSVAVAGVALGGPALLARLDEARCEWAIRDRKFPEALEICTRAHAKRPSGEAAASVAAAQVMARNADEAWRWANLPEAQTATRGMRVRGALLNMRGEVERAREELRRALTQALARGEASEASRAAHALAGIEWAAGRYSDAFESVERSREQAQKARDESALALAELALADIFRSMGDAVRAEQAYRSAVEASAAWPADHAFALMKLGVALEDRGAVDRAIAPLEEALVVAERSGNGWVTRACRSQLARLHAQRGDRQTAQRHLEALGDDAGARSTRARVAAAFGDDGGILSALEGVDLTPLGLDARLEAATVAGEAHRRLGDRKQAVASLNLAVDLVDELSANQPEYQGWVVARWRRPYDLLFDVHAEAGDFESAWDVFARYSLSEALSFEPVAVDDVRKRLMAAERIRAEWNESKERPRAEDAAAALPERELLLLHESESRLWVGGRREGRAFFAEVGPLEEWRPFIERALAVPGDEEAVSRLGEALWRSAGLEPSTRPLYVAATGRLRRLPLPALRVEGRLWVELRSIARLSSLANGGPRSVWSEQLVVVGDPEENLPHAADEARWVAGHHGVAAKLGGAASRTAVLRAHGARLLHIASHAEAGVEGTRLRMSDGMVSAVDVLRHRPAARVVVLASCTTSVGREAAGSDSLATAFLRAGSGAVLATSRSVPDEAAKRLVKAFYEHDGAQDPVEALARAQVDLSRTMPAEVWSAFLVTVGPGFE